MMLLYQELTSLTLNHAAIVVKILVKYVPWCHTHTHTKGESAGHNSNA